MSRGAVIFGTILGAGALWWLFRGSSAEERLFRRALPPHGRWMADAIVRASRKWNVSPFLLGAIVAWETDYGFAPGYTPKGAANGAGDKGHGRTPWQIDDRSHLAFLSTADLNDINVTTDYAVGHVIVPLLKKFPGNLPAVIAGYNAGAGNVSKAIARGADPGSVTTATPAGTYVDAVLSKLAGLRRAAGLA